MHLRAAVTGIGFELSSLEKVLWPATGFTKGQMVAYYESVASALLPHLADRPLTLGRFPNGVDQRGFAQTECRGRPEWLRTASIQLRNGQLRKFCLADDRRSLLWIANLNAIEFHMFLGTAAALDVPTAVLFDLDPEPPAGLVDAAAVAVMLRERLAADGLEALVKTTGGSGLHLLVPLNNPHAYAHTRRFAREIATSLAQRDERVSASATDRAGRAGKVLIDWAQNSERRSFVAPYSLRASDVPSVSTPVSWEEVERSAAPLRFGPHDVVARVRSVGDLFEPAVRLVQRLP